MNITNPGLVFALTSMFLLGISNFFYKRSAELLGPTNSTFYYYVISAVIASCVWPFFREKQPIASSVMIWPVLLAISLFLSVWSYNFALKSLDVSIASTVRGLFFVVPVVLAPVVMNENLSAKDYLAVGLAVIAVLLFGWSPKSE